MSSPWGKIDHVEKIVSGVSFVSTPRHGGLRVTQKALDKYAINTELITRLGAIIQGNYIFFEEDCAALLFLFDSPTLLKIDALKRGQDPESNFQYFKKIVERYYPDYFKDDIHE